MCIHSKIPWWKIYNSFIICWWYVDYGSECWYDPKAEKGIVKDVWHEGLGNVKHILGINILRDKKIKKLWLSQEKYIEWMLERFYMKNSYIIRSCPSIKKENGEKSIIPYSSIVWSLIYVMVCTCINIYHAIRVVIIFLENPNKTH